MTFQPVTEPAHWPHQLRALKAMKGHKAFFLSAEQRTGKTRIILDEVGLEFTRKTIDALLIVAMPSGAPRNWVQDEIPQWLSKDIKFTSLIWQANKVSRKFFKTAMEELLTFDGLSILAVNGEAIITENFKKYASKFLRKRRVYVAADETTLIMKTPGAKRTRTMYAIGKLAQIRRCLDGTPTGEGPMDLYSQYAFLDPAIIGYGSFLAYRNRYAVMEQGYNHTTGTDYWQVKKDDNGEPIYQNLEELQKKIEPYTFRVTRAEVFPNAPKPIFQKRRFELLEDQRRIYDDLENTYEAELEQLGQVTATHVLTRYLRLQQIASGYWPAQKIGSICEKCEGDGCEVCGGLGALEVEKPLTRIIPFEDNPRLLALKTELEFSKGPAIIWCRFNQEVDDVMQLCQQMGRRPVQYDGRISADQKYANKEAFQKGDASDFVGKTSSAGRAVRLDAARLMCYYSNTFSLLQRLQSQDRPEVGDRTFATDVVDFIANDTKDDLIVGVLRSKRKLTDVVMNEKREGIWL